MISSIRSITSLFPLVLRIGMAFGFLVVVDRAGADPITVSFSGVIDSVTDPVALPGIAPGMTFTGTYTIDPLLFPPIVDPGAAIGTAAYGTGPGSLDVDVEGTHFSRSIDRVWIADDQTIAPTAEVVDFWSFPIPIPPGPIEFGVSFTDYSMTRITDSSVFFVNNSLDGWDANELRFFDSMAATIGAGTIQTLAQTSPPLVPAELNIDFGVAYGVPAAGYGAAAGQPGQWNLAGLGATALDGLDGNWSGVTVDVSASLDSGDAGSPSEDDELLLKDNFFSSGGVGWDVHLSGMMPGDYWVFVYAPSNGAVSTGEMIVGGVALASLPGDVQHPGYPGSNLIMGTSWATTLVTIGEGTLVISGESESFSGLAGLQIVPAPEPGRSALLASGLVGLCLLARIRRSAER